MTKKKEEPTRTGKEIAVIGMAGRFPGAGNIYEFWKNLKNGVESISFLSAAELEEREVESQSINHPAYVKANISLEYKEYFDAAFFGYTALEAQIMNPQMRILHESAWEAMEDSGYNPEQYHGLIGLYAGASSSSYWETLSYFSGKSNEIGEFAAAQLTDRDFINTRISYNLSLKGPVITVQTACSTSLTAIHLASRALLTGECKMALAGGISLDVSTQKGYLYQEGMIPSPDGHCRAFDIKAKGTIGGNGAGLVLLKRLKNAIADRDHIYAVIKGTAINNDGNRKVGYTAPSVEAQAQVIQMALRIAGVEPGTIGYIETHGTGTPLGDPVEIKALTVAFESIKNEFCAVGSVKTNIGHLGTAAGVAGFIKTVLALKHKLIPPSLHFETPNPAIDFKRSPFYVNTTLKKWQGNGNPLRAGISSFGIGGTNAHVILEEAPAETCDKEGTKGLAPLLNAEAPKKYHLILLSAQTQSALTKITRNLADFLKNNPGINLDNAAYTLQVGRKVFPYRQILVCSDIEDAIDTLSTPDSRRIKTFFQPAGDDDNPVIFMFPGLGAQYVNMARELYRQEPIFRREMDRCFEILTPLLDYNIKDILYPGPDDHYRGPVDHMSHRSNTSYNSHKSHIHQIEIAQPIIFALEYSLAKLLMEWDIRPTAMIGYSFGEYAAASISGVFPLENALKLIVYRGELIKRTPAGMMLSVPLSLEELTPLLTDELSVAIDNGLSCIVAGSNEVIINFEQRLKQRKILSMRLQAVHAIHSKMMEPILAKFEGILRHIPLTKPQIPFISNVTGKFITPAAAADPAYWAEHLKATVQFSAGIKELLKNKNSIFIEIGPGNDLCSLVSRYFTGPENHPPINLIKSRQQKVADINYLSNKIGQLWLYGKTMDWSSFYSTGKRYRIPLPTYPFEGQRYWIDGNLLKMGAENLSGESPTGEKTGMADWFYLPSWKRSALDNRKRHKTGKTLESSSWLVFIGRHPLGPQLVKRLRHLEQDVITVRTALEFKMVKRGEYQVNPQNKEDYDTLLEEIKKFHRFPDKIIHMWGVDAPGWEGAANEIPGHERINQAQNLGFYSLLYLARVIGKQDLEGELQVAVITNDMQAVTGEENLCPEKSTVLGLIKVIPQEYSQIICRSIDVSLNASTQLKEKEWKEQILQEFTAGSPETIIAYRGYHRWVQTFEPKRLNEPGQPVPGLREKGVYLITGGLGDIGLVLAKYLAKSVKARLILTGRSFFPTRNEWKKWLTKYGEENTISRKINKIKELEDLGGEVRVFSVDIANRRQVQKIINRAESRYGSINGIIHSAGIINGPSIDFIHKLGKEECQQQFQAKIYGLLALKELFWEKELDFCWVISSIASILGGIRFAAYTAANIFMDTFIQKYARINGRGWISVNWDRNNPREITSAFQRILALEKVNQVVFSSGGNLQNRVHRWIKSKSLKEKEQSIEKEIDSPGTRVTRSRPYLSTPYIAPGNRYQETIAGIWENFLGYEQVGIQDNFFELGGDSLKAITVISKIHKELNINIPLAEFFNHPTIGKLSEYTGNFEKSTYYSITPREKKEYYLQSSAQKRLYFLQQMEMESTAYNMPQIISLQVEPDIGKLQGTFVQLIKRHENLRTSFDMLDNKPVQIIHEEVKFEIEHYDIPGVEVKVKDGDTGGTRGLAPLPIDDFIRPFDLSRAPLVRAGLAKSPAHLPLLLLDMHHIISDGVSMQILVDDFMSIYHGKPLPQLRLQYKDFVRWQDKNKKTGNLEKQKKYWLNIFKEEIPVLHLPLDFPRPDVQSFEGGTEKFEISIDETGMLRTIASRENATMYILLLTILNILLAKLSSQQDIVIGTPVAGRGHADLQNIIGMFVNTLALRNFPKGEKSFREFLSEVKERALAAFENQDYQYEDLVDKASVNRDAGRNPLFDVNYTLHTIARETGEEEAGANKQTAWAGEKQETHISISKFDLTFTGVESASQVVFTVEYCTKLFKKESIDRFITYFKQILSTVLKNSNQKIWQIEIITPQEKQQILYDFNDTAAANPGEETIHRLFAEQVRQTPDNIALIGHYRTYISYRELDEKSNQLAHSLREKNVTPGTIVGLTMERSIEMSAAILGILKAGSAYLPIDPGYPEERITYMLKDSGARILLKKSETNPNDPNSNDQNERTEVTVLDFEHLNFEFVSDFEFRASNLSSSELAYIIYTSGSTGKPKATPIAHRNANNYLQWFKREFQIGKEDKFCFTGNFCFDMSITSLLVPLISGASIYTVKEKIEWEPHVYTRCLAINKISIIKLTPTQFRVLKDFWEEEDLNSLRYIILGGEAANVDDIRDYLAIYNQQRLVNEYGPTEASVATVFHVVSGNDFSTGKNFESMTSSLPIGRPIYNTGIYILDKYRNLVPPGVIGELCIGGESVAPGYLNKPELTAEKFCLDFNEKFLRGGPGGAVFSKSAPPGRRRQKIYQTGDLARWLSDGNIEYLGRTDRQVKIKGYRIELDEIEAVLAANKELKAGIIDVKKDAGGNDLLVAYIIPKENQTTLEIREYLEHCLPAYMVPTLVTAVPELPMAASGKVDRKKLPGLSDLQLEGKETYSQPGSEKEKVLADTWKNVLGLSSVGVDDNFFHLGGDSIKAIQVVSRLRKHKFSIQVKDLFLHPTVKQLSRCMKRVEKTINQGLVQGEVEFTPIQEWFFEKYYIKDNTGSTPHNHYNQSAMLYRKEGFDRDVLHRVFTGILRHHDALRMIFPVKDGKVVQRNRGLEGELFHLQVIEPVEAEADTDIEKKIQKAAQGIQSGMNLTHGPLVRLGLFKTKNGDYLLIAIHHLVVDGVSWRILLEDFAIGYRQVMTGQPVTFQDKTDGFQYWASKLKEYAQSPAALKELDYWKSLKDTAIEALLPELPAGKDRANAKQYKHRDTINLELTEEETGKLLRKANRAYNTEINDILLAALGLAVKDWARIPRVLINLEGHGREDIMENVDISRTVGWFTTLFPVVLDLTRTTEKTYFIKQVKETLRQVPNRGIGHGILRYLGEGQKEDIALEPDISFNYLGEFGQESHTYTDIFTFSPIGPGSAISPELKSPYRLDINGRVLEKKLSMTFAYSKYEYKRTAVEKLVETCRTHLEDIIEACSSQTENQLTPSDPDYKSFTIHQLEVFEKKIRERAGGIENVYRLSPMQTGMYYHYLLDDDRSLYFEQFEISVQGEIDRDLLEKSFNMLLERYSVLRTIFSREDCPELLQIVVKKRKASLQFEDVSNLQEEALDNYIESFKQKDRHMGFDLDRDILIRIALLKTGNINYKIILSFHHIIMDGWCTGIIFKDLLQIYVLLRDHQPIRLETVKPYSQYIQWLESQDKKNSMEFWKEYLHGYRQPVQLPQSIDHAKDSKKSLEKHEFSLQKELTGKLVMRANENRVTLNVLIQTLWGLLLQKLNDTDDVVFGGVVSGRPQIEDVEHMVGLFINTIPIRVRLTKETKTFDRLAAHVQQKALAAQPHQYVPLAEVETCTPVKNKLVNHIIVFENYPVQRELSRYSAPNPTGIEIEELNYSGKTSYDFHIKVIPRDTIGFVFTYNTKLYAKAFVKKIASYFIEMVKQTVGSPGIETEKIRLISSHSKEDRQTQHENTKILEEIQGDFGF